MSRSNPVTSSAVDGAIIVSPATMTAASASDAAQMNLFTRLNASLPSPLSRVTVCYLLSGGAARVTSSILTAPLDCIKVRLQFSSRHSSASQDVRTYTGVMDVITKVWRQEGPAAFFRGLPARLAYVAPAAAISFVFYEQFRTIYRRANSNTPSSSSASTRSSVSTIGSALVPLFLGGLARICGSAFRTPFDLVRQRMQVQGSLIDRDQQVLKPLAERRPGIYANTGEAVWRVTKVEGVKTLWTGLGATIVRDLPFAAVYFFTYEWSKSVQLRYLTTLTPVVVSASSSSSPSALAGSLPSPAPSSSVPPAAAAGLSTPSYLASGAVAAACAVMATMPFDVIKVRLQTQGTLVQPKSNTYMQCVREIAREDGMRGFYKGTLPRLAYLVPAAAMTFTLYEHYKIGISRWMGIKEEP